MLGQYHSFAFNPCILYIDNTRADAVICVCLKVFQSQQSLCTQYRNRQRNQLLLIDGSVYSMINWSRQVWLFSFETPEIILYIKGTVTAFVILVCMAVPEPRENPQCKPCTQKNGQPVKKIPSIYTWMLLDVTLSIKYIYRHSWVFTQT